MLDNKIRVGGVMLTPLEAAFVSHAIDRGMIGPGGLTKSFERELAAVHGYKHCLCLNSGQSALMIALQALRLQNGRSLNVAVPAITYISSLAAVVQSQNTPVLVDVHREVHAEMDYDQMPEDVDIVMPVHLFGAAVKRNYPFKNISVEDACEACYAPGVGFGPILCTSFYSSHTITTGMGGAIMCNDDDLYFKCWQLVNHGRIKHDDYTDAANLKDRFTFDEIGYSLKYADINAALGLAQHYNRDNIIEARQYIGLLLTQKLQELGFEQDKHVMPIEDNTYMMFPILLDQGMDRDRIVDVLNQNNIETRMLMPITTQPVVKRLFGPDVEDRYPNAKFLNKHGFYIGCHPMMSDESVDHIAAVIKEAIQ